MGFGKEREMDRFELLERCEAAPTAEQIAELEHVWALHDDEDVAELERIWSLPDSRGIENRDARRS